MFSVYAWPFFRRTNAGVVVTFVSFANYATTPILTKYILISRTLVHAYYYNHFISYTRYTHINSNYVISYTTAFNLRVPFLSQNGDQINSMVHAKNCLFSYWVYLRSIPKAKKCKKVSRMQFFKFRLYIVIQKYRPNWSFWVIFFGKKNSRQTVIGTSLKS